MGIIEKAISHADSQPGARRTKKARVEQTGPATARRPADGDQGLAGDVIPIRNVQEKGFLSVSDNPALDQEFRFLKRPLLSQIFSPQKGAASPGHVVLVTSDLPGAGKSFISFNLAASIAYEQLTNVLLIDADPLRRNLTTVLDQGDRKGLLELIEHEDMIPEDVALETDWSGLRFIPSGQPRPNSTELLAGRRLEDLLTMFQDPDTVVILDSPPLLLTAESRVLAERVDFTLVVVESGRTTVGDVGAMLKMLSDCRSSIQFILNKAPAEGGNRAAGYYGYGYEYGD